MAKKATLWYQNDPFYTILCLFVFIRRRKIYLPHRKWSQYITYFKITFNPFSPIAWLVIFIVFLITCYQDGIKHGITSLRYVFSTQYERRYKVSVKQTSRNKIKRWWNEVKQCYKVL